MLENSFGVLIFLRKPSPFRNGPWLVFLRITVDGVSRELSLKRTWEPSKWIPRSGRAVGGHGRARTLNEFLDIVIFRVHEARKMLFDAGQTISAIGIRDIITGQAARNRMLIEIFKAHNDYMKSLIGKEYSKDTWTKYVRILDYVTDFLQSEYGVSDMNILAIDIEFGRRLFRWLRTRRNCSHNTSVKYLGMFKKILILCMENGWLKTDPFAKLKLSLEETDPVFLSAHELELVAGKKIENERLAIIRDIFLFCCMTSLCFIDVKNLKRSEVTIGIDGLLWIDKKRQKSKMPCRVPLLPLSMQILDKYKDYQYCINEDKLLPVCSNTKFNNYLKELAAICGINKNLTTHTARHTFGTTVTLANGVPMATVRSMMGHATDEQTRHYAKVLPATVSSDMKRLKRVLRSKRFLKGSQIGAASNIKKF